MNEYDLVVIGAGPGGYVASIRAAQLGLKVACIEKEPALGGTCLRVGCIPSKALLESSAFYAKTRKTAAKHGIVTEGIQLDLAAMQKRKNQVVAMLTRGVDSLFRKNTIDRLTGTARLASPNRVTLTTAEGNDEINAKHILIATGSSPSSIPCLPVDGNRILTSTEALAFEAVPEHLAVVGGGYIGVELGCVWSRLGAKVTIIEACDRILPQMDEELAHEAKKILAKQGLKFQLGTSVSAGEISDNHVHLSLSNESTLTVDHVLVAVGRRANTADLGIEDLGIQTDERGAISVNERFQTSIDTIYAIGDVIRGPMLAHKAEEEGVAFAEQLVTGQCHVNYDTIPGVVYTEPEIAAIGKTEAELVAAKVPFRKAAFPYRANGRARASDQTDGFAKLLVAEADGTVLGAHLIGAHAGELINEVSVVMTAKQSADQLARTCHAHPTFGEILKEAALQAEERPIHS